MRRGPGASLEAGARDPVGGNHLEAQARVTGVEGT